MSSRLSNLWVLSTSAMRPLNLSTMPLVLGVLGLVSRCSMPSAWHNWSNSWLPLAWRSPLANSRSVNSLPLSVSNLLILIGQALCNAFMKACAPAALVAHLGQVFHIHVHVARLVALEGLVGHRRLLGLEACPYTQLPPAS